MEAVSGETSSQVIFIGVLTEDNAFVVAMRI
jgi:hypothetical protein